MYNGEYNLSKETVDSIKDNVTFDIHPYETLGGGSKGFYIKVYVVNWDYKFNISLNALKCKDIIQYNNRHTQNHVKRRIRDVSHIISIAPFINAIIEN